MEGALTTFLILGWVATFCLAVTVLCVIFLAQYAKESPGANEKQCLATVPLVFPSLAVAPLCIFLSWLFMRVNLIFPVFEFTGMADLVTAGIAPAAILFTSSGLFGRILATSRNEWNFWTAKPFFRVESALGKDPRRRLRPLIATRSLLQSASDCLPLVFSELVIIESIFNAPGIGYWSWEYAKTREITSAAQAISVLFIAYGFMNTAISFANRRLGRKLAGYL